MHTPTKQQKRIFESLCEQLDIDLVYPVTSRTMYKEIGKLIKKRDNKTKATFNVRPQHKFAK